MEKFRVLVTEKIGEVGLDLLRAAPDVELDVKLGLTSEEIIRILPDYDGILTRSGTTMDEAKIEAGKRLRVIGRAGVGVDNINLAEASRRGIIVLNAPSGNTLAATELTMANMLAVVRRVPHAFHSVKSFKWERSRFVGCQLAGKRLLIIGLGRIGSEVAKRAQAFGMTVTAYDPYIPQKKADALHVELLSDLEGAISLADIVTIHTPLTEETTHMINVSVLRAFKPGAYLINCARGGLLEEAAVAEALRSGRLAGFATDVYSAEPPAKEHPYMAEDLADKIVLTPHIGANTKEAQSEVARIAALNMLRVLRNEPYECAVNLPFMEQSLNKEQKMYLALARKLGIIATKLAIKLFGSAPHEYHVTMCGSLFENDARLLEGHYRPYTIAVLKGGFEVSLDSSITYMIAPILAKDRHITIGESYGESSTYKNTIEVCLETPRGNIALLATITEEGRERIVRINDYHVDFVPNKKILIFQNHDRPGVIGKIGTILGKSEVNIANFALGRKDGSGLAVGVLEFDGEITEAITEDLLKNADIVWAVSVDFSKM